MGLAVGNKILASDFVALKARVKAECKRRKYKGSIESYGGSAYDYTVTPVKGGLILAEHLNKLVQPMNKINNTGYSTVKKGDRIKSIAALEAFVTASEGYSLTGTSTNCKASCTGLCLGGCGNTCTGCSGSCKGGCGGTCSSSCSGGCGGSCGGTCSNGCYEGDCSGACYNQCTNTCQGACSGGCKSTCKGQCSGGCRTGDEY